MIEDRNMHFEELYKNKQLKMLIWRDIGKALNILRITKI